ncbi:MAG: hypothetical protein AB9907_04020 [Flexilinea sp.]
MMKQQTFLLLDIDGVLLRPGGYRQSYIDTVNHFLCLFGQPHLSVNMQVAEKFEFAEIQAEWDMVPLSIAAFLEWYAENSPDYSAFQSIVNAENLPSAGTQEDFYEFLLKKIMDFSGVLTSIDIPALAVYKNCRQRQSASVLPCIWNDSILDEFLADSLNVYKSPFFRRLENTVLGSKVFMETFGFPAEENLISNLEKLDSPIISKEYREKLANLNENGHHAAIITARPNLLPESVSRETIQSHTILPEAETALRLIGWKKNEMITIGVGSLCYMEQKYNLPKDTLLKPHAYHSLAAILNTLCDNQLKALETAKKVSDLWDRKDFTHNPMAGFLPEGSTIRLAVFEDSTSGIKSCMNAGVILNAFGYSVTTETYGIYTTDEKQALLTAINAEIFPDINRALDVFFSRKAAS